MSSQTKLPGWIIPTGILAALVIGALMLWGTVNSIRNEAVAREVQLSAQYRKNQNHLSAFISEFKETVGIADRKTDQLDRVLVDAVSGRYGEEGFGTGGVVVKAIREAYPRLDGLDIYDKVIDTIRAGRSDFKNEQDVLLDQIRSYDEWRKKGIIRSWALSGYAPSNNLVARVGNNQVLTGQAAYDKMSEIILIDDANKAYQSGTMEALEAPPLPARPSKAP